MKTLISLLVLALLTSSLSLAQQYQRLPADILLDRLKPASGKIRAVIDTDTYNEIDDQFAVVYALLAREKIELEAIYAAPYLNNRSTSPADGMEKSYEEILRLLEKLDMKPPGPVLKGSDSFLESYSAPIQSPAAEDLIRRAKSSAEPLYVLTLGAPTNVASAILMDPSIIHNIVIVWLGGKGLNWPFATEFNLMQDLLASKVMFDSGAPLIQLPTEPVTSHLLTSVAEIEVYLKGQGAIGDYLVEIFKGYNKGDPFGWSKVIWDIAVIAYIVNPGWFQTEIRHSPLLTDQFTYSVDHRRHFYRVATHLNRDRIFGDLFKRIHQHASK
ncbi:Inosine-uridine preferring nucleoside hydrolase [Lunatimonas lonarensis]|uniref:Inosine-uridine preferring nucleoside hydrolase n=1 Tax=Lunatimonas lonarensis TaxID=1232681 RepID=R7ZTY9_9BACT|nr:nucleoside hydrolase [Lunatimonas lonarensis]EON77469.1 Inosine-uridine preferring nucleoside hydrolase [Lunatimonas lonarensis]